VVEVVNDLFAFAMGNAGPAPGAHASVKEVLGGVVAETDALATDRCAQVVVAPFEASTEVACAPGVLTSMVSNLVRNALKYIGDGPARRVTVRTLQHPDKVTIEVIDTGPGLAPGERAKIFEPYVRGSAAKSTGLGLGLATVKRLAEAHGGGVGVRSNEGQGATFWFDLPRAH
jgi:signal transduction histidine kinase